VPNRTSPHPYRLQTPRMVRVIAVFIAAAVLFEGAVFFTIGTLADDGPPRTLLLCVVWGLTLVGLAMLHRAWRSLTPRRAPPQT
jgi:hypothetical protein